MEQKIESKVEAPKVAANVEAKAPVAKEAKVQVKKEFSKDAPVEATKEKVKSVFVKKRSQFADYKLFNRWSFDDVVVTDLSLVRYINLDPVVVPHSFGRKTRGRFERQNLNIVERLINKIMRSGQGKRKLSGKVIRGRGSCGKKIEAVKIIEDAFEIIEKQLKQNPIQVFVKALENSAPREDVTRVKKGGVSYTLAVDLAPLKRLDEAIKNLALGGFGSSFNKKVTAAQALADEIMAAASNDIKSMSIKRKDEVERIAKSSR